MCHVGNCKNVLENFKYMHPRDVLYVINLWKFLYYNIVMIWQLHWEICIHPVDKSKRLRANMTYMWRYDTKGTSYLHGMKFSNVRTGMENRLFRLWWFRITVGIHKNSSSVIFEVGQSSFVVARYRVESFDVALNSKHLAIRRIELSFNVECSAF